MTITVQPTRNEYTATASQTVFNYTFKIFTATDLNVYITPTGQACDDATDITTAYTVSGVGDESGGTITLTTPATLNDLVTIVGNVPASRTTDYQFNGDFTPDTVNADFDRVVSLTKQVEDLSGRALLFPECLQNASALSLDAPEALSFVRWNAAANGLENVSPSVGTGDMLGVNNLSDVASATTSRQNLGIEIGVDVQGFDADIPTSVVPQAEAEAGVATTNRTWTAERVKQAVDALGGDNVSRNYIDGLITSNGTDTNHDIDTAAGECSDSTNTVTIKLISSITKQIDSNWVEGTNLGGFPSGLTLAGNTWYHYFVIAKTDGTVDAGWDTSLTASNLLADATEFTLFRLIASHRADGGSNIIAFTQKGAEFLWSVPISDVNTSNPGTSAVLFTVTSPLGIKTNTLASYSIIDASPAAQTLCIITSPDQADTAPITTLFDMRILSTVAGGPSIHKEIRTNLSSQIRFRLDNSDAGVSFRSILFGFIHPRGKE